MIWFLSNEELYLNVVSPLLDAALNGERCICVAWGGPGSGKTHTLHGRLESLEHNSQSFQKSFLKVRDPAMGLFMARDL